MSPEARRELLLDTAIRIFANKGLDGARHGDVAKAAKVSIPTVHSYFKTRNDLVSAVLQEVREYVIKRCIVPFLDGPTFEDRMMSSGQNLIHLVNQDPDYFKVWVMWGTYFGEPYKSQFEQYEKESMRYLCQLITGNPDSVHDKDMVEKARVLVGLSLFLAQMALRGESEEEQTKYIQNVMKTLQIWL